MDGHDEQCSWRFGQRLRKRLSLPRHTKAATSALERNGSFHVRSQRQKFVIGVRGLAHALDGIKIFQGLDAGQGLGRDNERGVFGQGNLPGVKFVLMKCETRKTNDDRGGSQARNDGLPAPAEKPPAGLVHFFPFDGLHHAGGEIGSDRRIRQAGEKFPHLPSSILERLIIVHVKLKTGVRLKLRRFLRTGGAGFEKRGLADSGFYR
jgi:hypothetical protein